LSEKPVVAFLITKQPLMKTVLLVIHTLLSATASAQFAIIQDKDGYCNVRSAPKIGDNVKDKLNNGHVVYRFEVKGNWAHINYTKGKKELSGNMYADRLKLVSDYTEIPMISETENIVTLKKDIIEIAVTQKKFNKNKYKLSYYKDSKEYIEFINGKQYWGTDGPMPKTAYKSIVVYMKGGQIILPPTATANLFEPSLYNTQAYYDKLNDILYIESMNSDGAGAYEVIWKIEKGIYKDRLIMYGF
jgi:hypothetical protein